MRSVLGTLALSVALAAAVEPCPDPARPGPERPEVFTQPLHQSPLRALPGDLVTIAGAGLRPEDVVVYERVEAGGLPQRPRWEPGDPSDESGGRAQTLSPAGAAPETLVVRLDRILPGQTYALWVRRETPRGVRFSAPMPINDARPSWLSPGRVHTDRPWPGMQRRLRVVGRNLQPTPDSGPTRVRLSRRGMREWQRLESIPAVVESFEDAALEHYVVEVRLPPILVAGEYDIEVSRDGANWVGLSDQALEVVEPPRRVATVDALEAGECDASVDVTPCLVAALEQARRAVADSGAAARAEVRIPGGVWTLRPRSADIQRDGIVVPRGVDLVGAGRDVTALEVDAGWTAPTVFTLSGANTVRDLHLADRRSHDADPGAGGTYFRLGRRECGSDGVADLTLTSNRFSGANQSLADAGCPLRRLIVTDNEFQSYKRSINLSGNPRRHDLRFVVEDAVIRGNLFYPGRWLWTVGANRGEIDDTGTLASSIGGSRRLDFSSNLAPGDATFPAPPGFEACSAEQPEVCGWRAAFFFSLVGSHEQLLISRNAATCTGDKSGDGEFLALDQNHNEAAFAELIRDVATATATSVTLRGTTVRTPGFYEGFWAQVGAGRGLGQARRIVGVDAASESVTFEVRPAWDVVPDSSSAIAVGRIFWQVHVVGNQVNNAYGLCRQDNREAPTGGKIFLDGNAADCAVEANRQIESDGIWLNANHNVDEPGRRWFASQLFTEVRSNRIEGEVDFDETPRSGRSQSGISLRWAGDPDDRGPIGAYGVSIAHNRIRAADALFGGAIAVIKTGRIPAVERMVRSLSIFRNSIRDLRRLDADGNCRPIDPFENRSNGGVAIHLHVPNSPRGKARRAYYTVIDGNEIDEVCFELDDGGVETRHDLDRR